MIGYITEEEGQTLQELASKVTEGVIVNIGTFQGKSAIYMALGRTEAKVYTIDYYEYELFDEYVKQFGVEDKIIKIVESSSTVNWDKPVGLIFIDGLHSYEDVAKDYFKFEPFVVKGGIMVFHDYKFDIVGIEVKKFLEDHQKEISLKFVIEKKVENMLCLRKI